jgi:hypothetical protein
MAKSGKGNIWAEREMILSPGFHKLKATAIRVLLLFLCRRQWEKAGRKGKWHQTNNGEILFPYYEAQKKFNISKSSFARAIDQLVEFGFIDISHLGGGMVRDCSKYAISNRWRNYGTKDFIKKSRPKDKRKLGFTPENWERRTGRKRRRKPNSGIANDTSLSIEIDTCNIDTKMFSSIGIDTEDKLLNLFFYKGLEVLKAFSPSQYQN